MAAEQRRMPVQKLASAKSKMAGSRSESDVPRQLRLRLKDWLPNAPPPLHRRMVPPGRYYTPASLPVCGLIDGPIQRRDGDGIQRQGRELPKAAKRHSQTPSSSCPGEISQGHANTRQQRRRVRSGHRVFLALTLANISDKRGQLQTARTSNDAENSQGSHSQLYHW